MKLATKFRRYFLTVTLGVLAIGGISQFVIYRYTMHRTTDDMLMEYKYDIEDYVRKTDRLPTFNAIELEHSYLIAYNNPHRSNMAINHKKFYENNDIRKKLNIRNNIYDSLIYSEYELEQVVYRVTNFPIYTTQDGLSVVTLALPTLEQKQLVFAVFFSSLGLFLAFISSMIYGVKALSKMMRPFYQILDKIRKYDIRTNNSHLAIPRSNIDEFDELSHGLSTMLKRMHVDYISLKEFTENTSHELQTPIAAAIMKIEQLQQICADNEQAMHNISSILNSMYRMSRFNKSLMLITRISNNHFYEREPINLTYLIDSYIEDHKEMIQIKDIHIIWNSKRDFIVQMHHLLSDFLINNILSNAIKYNKKGGRLILNFYDSYFEISNTYSNKIPDEDLFKRYVRSENKQATGLGLQIVKEICNQNDLESSITITDELFTMKISKEKRNNVTTAQ